MLQVGNAHFLGHIACCGVADKLWWCLYPLLHLSAVLLLVFFPLSAVVLRTPLSCCEQGCSAVMPPLCLLRRGCGSVRTPLCLLGMGYDAVRTTLCLLGMRYDAVRTPTPPLGYRSRIFLKSINCLGLSHKNEKFSAGPTCLNLSRKGMKIKQEELHELPPKEIVNQN